MSDSTERERMVAGRTYRPPILSHRDARRDEARAARVQQPHPDDEERRWSCCEAFGKVGQGLIAPRLSCDYGAQISMGSSSSRTTTSRSSTALR